MTRQNASSRTARWNGVTPIVLAFLCASSYSAGAQAGAARPAGPGARGAERAVPVTVLTFPGDHKEDGFWTAIGAASDGRVYLGLCSHGGSGQFYVYDPSLGQLRHIAGMQEATGQLTHGTESQGKLHSQMVEDGEGRIWFGTDMSYHSYFAMWDDPNAYPGGHLMMYDPQADQLHDRGTLLPRHAIRHVAVDRVRQRIYAVTFPTGRFLVHDIRTGITTDKGRVNNWDSVARVMVLDDVGNVYGSFAPYRMFKYDVEADRLVDLPVTYPHRVGPWNDRGHGHRENIWRNAVWDPIARVIYGMDQGSATLFRFDPRTYAMVDLGQLVIEKFQGERIVPYTSHGFLLHPNRRIYYTAPPGDNFQSPVRLLEYDPATGDRRDLGPLMDEAAGVPVDLQGAAVAPDGTVYFAGWIRLKGTESSNPENGRAGTVMGLVILRPEALAAAGGDS